MTLLVVLYSVIVSDLILEDHVIEFFLDISVLHFLPIDLLIS